MKGREITRSKRESPLERAFFLEPFSSLQREMNDLLENFWHTSRFPQVSGAQTFAPVDITEDPECFHLKVDLPGFAQKDVTVALEDDATLVIHGKRDVEHEEKGRTWLRRERAHDEVRRTIGLPCQVDAEKVTATIKDGVLTVDAPKSHESLAKHRPIQVKKA